MTVESICRKCKKRFETDVGLFQHLKMSHFREVLNQFGKDQYTVHIHFPSWFREFDRRPTQDAEPSVCMNCNYPLLDIRVDDKSGKVKIIYAWNKDGWHEVKEQTSANMRWDEPHMEFRNYIDDLDPFTEDEIDKYGPGDPDDDGNARVLVCINPDPDCRDCSDIEFLRTKGIILHHEGRRRKKA